MAIKITLGLLRISLGWLMFYAGITKVLDPEWTSAGFLGRAKAFPELFSALADPSVLPLVDFLNQWGLTLLGVSLILGVGVRISSVLGALLMVMYYLPNLADFPRIGSNYVVDQHVIYALLLLFFAAADAGRAIGLQGWALSKFPKLSWLLR